MDMARPAFASEFGTDDEMDTALGLALRASFMKNPAGPEHPASGRDSCRGAGRSSSTFVPAAKRANALPDGAIEICRDAKRRKVWRGMHPLPSSGSEADGDVGGDPGLCEDEGAEDVVAGPDLKCKLPLDDLPDELLANILKKLSYRDLCSATQTCKRWHFIGMQDAVWDSRVVEGERSINCAGKSCPKWTTVKNMTLSDRVIDKQECSAVDRTMIECSKLEMNYYWWESGNPAVLVGGRELPARGGGMCPDTQPQLSYVESNLLYEAVGMAFIDRTDHLANLLLAYVTFQEEPAHGSSSGSKQQHQIPSAQRQEAGVRGTDGSKGKWSQLSSHDYSDEGRKSNLGIGHAGVSLWREVVTLWKRYTSWLSMIDSHSSDGVWWHKQFAEHQRSHALFAPSTLSVLGVICFRSQIILRYGLRGLLQAGSNWLQAQNSAGCASDEDVELLNSVHHLLQELDVEDDFIFTATGYTREKLRRCFNGLGNSN